MQKVKSADGATISYDLQGNGPPLVLVHGSFSDHVSNWMFAKPLLEEKFTLYSIARRGRGETDATKGHSMEDEARDVVAVLEAVGEPAFILGHSYGAHSALLATAFAPHRVRRMILYEPVWPTVMRRANLDTLDEIAARGDWDSFTMAFFCDVLQVPREEMNEVRASEAWEPTVSDAEASHGDLRALFQYKFDPDRFADLRLPVLLQTGSESPKELFATDALAAKLPDVHIDELSGQAHEGPTTGPEMFVDSVTRFLLAEGAAA